MAGWLAEDPKIQPIYAPNAMDTLVLPLFFLIFSFLKTSVTPIFLQIYKTLYENFPANELKY